MELLPVEALAIALGVVDVRLDACIAASGSAAGSSAGTNVPKNGKPGARVGNGDLDIDHPPGKTTNVMEPLQEADKIREGAIAEKQKFHGADGNPLGGILDVLLPLPSLGEAGAPRREMSVYVRRMCETQRLIRSMAFVNSWAGSFRLTGTKIFSALLRH